MRAELNDPSGLLPYEWAQQSALSQLNVRSNCGVCGNLPPYPQLYSRSLTVSLWLLLVEGSAGLGCALS